MFLVFLLEETHSVTYFLWSLAGFSLPCFHVHPKVLLLTIDEIAKTTTKKKS